MCSMALVVTWLALGVDAGWQPLPGGGLEYIIQIRPGRLESLEAGEMLGSDIPPDLRGEVRSYRIVVGDGELPRVAPVVEPDPPADPSGFFPEDSPRELSDTVDPIPSAEQLAVFNEEIGQPADGTEAGANPETGPGQDASKPWLPLTLALASLFAAVGGMLYLGWLAWDYRRRYRALIERILAAGEAGLPMLDGLVAPDG